MQGRRITWQEADNLANVQPGDYWYDPREPGAQWYAACPNARDDDGMIACLAALCKHTVTEHEDGTITVSPSILVGRNYPNSPPEWAAKHTWHGWLEHGIWREA